MSEFAKREISLRYWLQGAEFYHALEAMAFAKDYHIGTRKDGITPEFDHQVSIGHYIRSLHTGIMYPEDTIATVFLHDVREDHGVSSDEIESRFGSRVSNAVDAMTKEFRGIRRPEIEVFEKISKDPCASVAKGGDRIHNFSSMVGVFSIPKQKEYIQEGKDYFLPMLKTSRRLFVRQEPVYENIKTMLITQMTLIDAIHQSKV
jgi:(p)ppGpp synthase/HD superfamily hydrolase